MKSYIFSKQVASSECPAVPKTVRVSGESLAHATERLAAALKADPELKGGTDHLLTEEKREPKAAIKKPVPKKSDSKEEDKD